MGPPEGFGGRVPQTVWLDQQVISMYFLGPSRRHQQGGGWGSSEAPSRQDHVRGAKDSGGTEVTWPWNHHPCFSLSWFGAGFGLERHAAHK